MRVLVHVYLHVVWLNDSAHIHAQMHDSTHRVPWNVLNLLLHLFIRPFMMIIMIMHTGAAMNIVDTDPHTDTRR